MSSTDHYAEAVGLLARKSTVTPVYGRQSDGYSAVMDSNTRPPTPEEVAQAQVHATLALAAELAMIREHLSGA